jgi:hypothetical protein
MHFEATLCCPGCSHVFRVCVDADAQPGSDRSYIVCCPKSAGEIVISGALLQKVDTCTGGVAAREFIAAAGAATQVERIGPGEGFARKAAGCGTVFFLVLFIALLCWL